MSRYRRSAQMAVTLSATAVTGRTALARSGDGADDIGALLDLAVEPLETVGRTDAVPVLPGEGVEVRGSCWDALDLSIGHGQDRPSMTPVLETPRLWLRPLELADAVQVQVLFPHWQIVRYLNAVVPWPYPPDGALTFYRDVALPKVASGEAWHWTLRLKDEPDQIVGAINLNRGERENRGFWIGLPWQRRGLATEACAAANTFWFEVLGFSVLRVGKAAANEASRRVSMREGMRLVGTEEREFVSGLLPAELWELTADEWRAQASRPAAEPTHATRRTP